MDSSFYDTKVCLKNMSKYHIKFMHVFIFTEFRDEIWMIKSGYIGCTTVSKSKMTKVHAMLLRLYSK